MIGSVSSLSSSAWSQTNQVDFSAMRQRMAEKMFTEMDADGSGEVSKDEFVSWDKEMRESRPAMAGAGNMPSAEDIFSSADADGSGSLSQDELSEMGKKMGAPSGPPPGAPPGGAGGGADVEKLLSALSSGLSESSDASDTSESEESSESTSSSSKSLDANGDGKVSLNELLAWLKSYSSSQGQSIQSSTGSSMDLVA